MSDCGCNKKKKNPLPVETSLREEDIPEYSLRDAVTDTIMRRAEIVSREVKRERLLICGACPHIIRPTFNCDICGCFMRKKTKFAKASCPLRTAKHGEAPRWLPAVGIGIEEEVDEGLLD